jgi:hypothetical protein
MRSDRNRVGKVGPKVTVPTGSVLYSVVCEPFINPVIHSEYPGESRALVMARPLY